MTLEQTIASARVLALLSQMTLEEKLAQLVGYWVDQGDEVVAPMAGEMATSTRYEDATAHGIGHLTRVYGTRPVDPVERARWLWAEQRRLQSETRLGIPAIVHEEVLTGVAAWKAATFPTPLAWGASFDPELVERMGGAIGRSLRELGVHQGLAPVLDVIRDPRWGRVDECISEDPYVVGTVGTAFVQGLQGEGIHATLKHFVGYSASQAGRNHAPVHAGPRELADVLLPPFEMAVRLGGVRSVMNSYAEIDGMPVAATREWLTELLRDRWGFDGVVVSDYFAVAFLHSMHGVAADRAEAAALALAAGIDVELPSGDAYVEPLAAAVRDGRVPESLVDQAVLRVLAQKEELGLLDARFDDPPAAIDLDDAEHRALALELAQASVVLVSNTGVLPLRDPERIALIGPNADSAEALMGCYSFVNHVLAHHPGVEPGFALPTLAEALAARYPGARIRIEEGCSVDGGDVGASAASAAAAVAADDARIAAAVEAAAPAEVAIVVVGDRAGLFGRGTVGEGNDVESLELPGRQRELVEAVAATGTPVVLVVLSGRPYAIGWAVDGLGAEASGRVAAVVQSFFPGEEGGMALASILSGDVAPSGHLPVSLPRSAGAQPFSYLHPRLGGPTEITSADSTPVRSFGHGLSYTSFERTALLLDNAAVPTSAGFVATVRVKNTGRRAGTDLVQLYGHDVHASVTRPVAQLLGYLRVPLQPGEEVEVRFEVPASRLAFSDARLERVVEPGALELWVGGSCDHRETSAVVELTGGIHRLDNQPPELTRAAVVSGRADG
ncbi:glycoside hydrolase family 3 N-terminal domain-containing protein [Herbiconiux sp. KACC 21604]|uniref:beta-xylosidase/alpha-l-arabinosidase n=1 Tax=unclassified Herbiconiux TaxID=2618217 RepID=UPI001492B56A|nr:glycoside hydrolase family 3 N-terminal domain-containing protein [Herbiconiux sp. SALV-R1]QJU52643.1 glycosyl hydrolase [Herbiconiux sp. SALV-R1]WPO87535.1 glycoside hydrolase family 3 N-terminal domain-containing protein [Herbiconiux sp. KACC 21604]